MFCFKNGYGLQLWASLEIPSVLEKPSSVILKKKLKPRYTRWLPDDAHLKQLHDTKTVYDVRIRYFNNTNATFSFHGPRGNTKCIGK